MIVLFSRGLAVCDRLMVPVCDGWTTHDAQPPTLGLFNPAAFQPAVSAD
jgi:hypothetical protein